MRKAAAVLFIFVFLIASSLISLLPANAESKKIIVPDDYPTIQEAIDNATDGDTIFVKKGTYEENPLEINKTLSLIGEGADSTKISFDPPYTEFSVNIFERHKVYEDPIKVHADFCKLVEKAKRDEPDEVEYPDEDELIDDDDEFDDEDSFWAHE